MASILFLSLDTFSRSGGIQQFNRLFSLALQRNREAWGWQVQHLSLWDDQPDEQYFPATHFQGFQQRRWAFFKAVISRLKQTDVLVLSHINLAIVGWLAKMIAPRTKVVLMAHGVELWQPLSWVQQKCLQAADAVWAVSQFTANDLMQRHKVPAGKLQILHNTLDPYFESQPAVDPGLLQQRWRLGQAYPVLLTVARLKTTEEAKGYDQVLELLPGLVRQYPQICYIMAGPWEQAEYDRIIQKAAQLGVSGHLAITGFVANEALPALYRLSQVFVMPSTKEGFGIVFLEAAWSGCQVVAANAGGAPEALLHGKLGKLVPPAQKQPLQTAIEEALAHPLSEARKDLQKKLVEEQFGFRNFTRRQASLLQPYL